MDQGQTRLWVDGVRSPIVSEVTDRQGARWTIEQALPFLRLDNEVHDEARRRGRIEWVGLAYQGDTPRLVVDLVYDEPAEEPAAELADEPAERDDPTVQGLDDTIPALHAEQLEPPQLPQPAKRRRDETVPFVTEGARASREIVISDAPPAPAPPRPAHPVPTAIGAQLVWWLTRFGQTAERIAAQLVARLRAAPA